MRGSFDRFPRRASLIVPPNPALQHRHPMANGLRQLWLPEWTRGQDRLRNLVRTSGESQVADFTPTAPTWTTGVSGAALAFDGAAKQLLHSAPPASLWNPGLGGLAYTMAFIGRIKSHPGGGRILYSHNQSTSGVRSIEISASSTDLQFFVTQDSGTTEKVSATLTTIPAIGSLFAVIATIRDGTTSAIAMRDFQAGTRGTATNTAGTITAATVTTIDQESFCSWHGGGTATDFADADMAGAFGWGRAFTDADMQAWLDDPFGVVTPRRAPAYIGPGSTALGVTLSTQWTVIPATASLWTFADAFVTFDNPAFLFDGGMAVAGGSDAAGVTLTTQWTVLGGQPAATATAPSAGTLTTTWTLFPNRQLGGLTLPTQWSVSTSGTATSGAAAAGQTLTTSWTVFPGGCGRLCGGGRGRDPHHHVERLRRRHRLGRDAGGGRQANHHHMDGGGRDGQHHPAARHHPEPLLHGFRLRPRRRSRERGAHPLHRREGGAQGVRPAGMVARAGGEGGAGYARRAA
jgi:hypothetical protein